MKKMLSLVIVAITLWNFSFLSCAVNEEALSVNAKGAVLMDAMTGKILFSKDEHKKLYPASVTKIMPMLLIVEAIDSGRISLEDRVTVSLSSASKGGSQIWLKEGEQMTVDELLKATAIGSANDACAALGEYIAGSEEAFVALMNERAKRLGMVNTNFVNCTGLDDDTTEHLTTAYDIALMSKELLGYDIIRKYSTIWMDSLRNGKTQLVNTNRLVRFYEGTTGLKTGTTSKAGYCLAASAERNGLHLIAVILGAENSSERFEDAKEMLNWGFANFECCTPEIDLSSVEPIRVLKGIERYLSPVIISTESVIVKKGASADFQYSFSLPENLMAPVEKGQIIGTVSVKNADETVCTYNLVSEKNIEKVNLSVMVKRFIKSLTLA